jgi:hypothetical protein
LESRWRRLSAAWAARSSSSRAPRIYFPARRPRWAKRSATCCAGALIALLDRKGLLCKEEVLAEIKSLQQQLAQRTGELPDSSQAFPQPYLNVQAENALVDRILELFNAAGLTAHQAKILLGRVMNLIELGERVSSKTTH